MEEKPPWFNEKMRSMIPADMIPSLAEQKRRAIEGVKGAKGATTNADLSKGEIATMISGIKTQVADFCAEGKAAKKYAKVAPAEEGGGITEERTAELIRMSRKGSMT